MISFVRVSRQISRHFGAIAQSPLLLGLTFALCVATAHSTTNESWPELSQPPTAIGGGEKDAAVIVGVQNYLFVEKIPGARNNADDWQAYLTETLKVPQGKVTPLRDDDATVEEMRDSITKAALQVENGGTLWFVFIGHGAPAKDGNDGLLVGVDAQQKAQSIYTRSLSRNDLLNALAKGKQTRTVVLIDACFSGKSSSGGNLVEGLQPLVTMRALPQGLDSRTILLTAAQPDQFAGPLPNAVQMRPAFSYLALGALRGWAADDSGKVTTSALIDFARKALALAHDRTQTPELGVAVDFVSTGSSLAAIRLKRFGVREGKVRLFQPQRNVKDVRQLGSHAKFCVVDSQHVYVGSANLASPGLGTNLEMGFLIHGAMANRITSMFRFLTDSGFVVEVT